MTDSFRTSGVCVCVQCMPTCEIYALRSSRFVHQDMSSECRCVCELVLHGHLQYAMFSCGFALLHVFIDAHPFHSLMAHQPAGGIAPTRASASSCIGAALSNGGATQGVAETSPQPMVSPNYRRNRWGRRSITAADGIATLSPQPMASSKDRRRPLGHEVADACSNKYAPSKSSPQQVSAALVVRQGCRRHRLAIALLSPAAGSKPWASARSPPDPSPCLPVGTNKSSSGAKLGKERA